MQEHQIETYLNILEETLALVEERSESLRRLQNIKDDEERNALLQRLKVINEVLADNSMLIDKLQKKKIL